MADKDIVHQPAIAAEIIAAHKAANTAARSALEHARVAGEKLIEAKANIGHGQWLPWVAEHLPMITERTVQNYMKVATHWGDLEKRNGVSGLPLRDVLKLLAEPKVKTAAADDTSGSSALVNRPLTREESRINREVFRARAHASALATQFETDANIAHFDASLRSRWTWELRETAKWLTEVADAFQVVNLRGARRG